jgi:hypothetical protein
MPKMKPAELSVNEHGIKWWLDRGVKCPDCNDTNNLVILNQRRESISRCASDMCDAQYTADFVCGNFTHGVEVTKTFGCGCKFKASYVEKEVIHKKPLYSRW